MKHLVSIFLPKNNIYIELEYRQLCHHLITKPLYLIKKVDIWISSKKLSEACVFLYICFGFADGKNYLIKYNKELFGSFDTKCSVKWNATNCLVPLTQCVSLDEFVDNIKLLTSSC